MKTYDVIRLALEGQLAIGSARKALRDGPRSLRGRAGERAADAMKRLGLTAESRPSEVPPQSAA